ncbi:hypothetical protein L2E82_22666 [Cichorium intybus]|uniref:Uncharacterized protein n=1 Tax=Cichorium intybus TaxID=13427 RepID=A0ACB9DYL4_CICIN|nr:hypothetical protein L2E82_22666 [Cichorium intybus]
MKEGRGSPVWSMRQVKEDEIEEERRENEEQACMVGHEHGHEAHAMKEVTGQHELVPAIAPVVPGVD